MHTHTHANTHTLLRTHTRAHTCSDNLFCINTCTTPLQVQLQTLLLERLAQTFSISLLYSSLGMPWPLLQAVAINALSLAVGIAIDVHNRRTYMKASPTGHMGRCNHAARGACTCVHMRLSVGTHQSWLQTTVLILLTTHVDCTRMSMACGLYGRDQFSKKFHKLSCEITCPSYCNDQARGIQ